MIGDSAPAAVNSGACRRYNSPYTPFLGDQLIVRALLGQLAVLDDEDDVGVADRVEVMGDDDRRPALHQFSRAPMTACSDSGVQPGRGLVENQDRRVADDGAGDGDALALAAGQRDATLAHHRVVAVGHRVDELVRVGQFGRALDLRGRARRLAVRDVLPDGRAKEQRVLQHKAHLVAQRLQLVPPDVRALDDDLPGDRVVEPWNQAHERRLARRRTDRRWPRPVRPRS